MRVEINHREITLPDMCTLYEALAREGLDGPGKAVAVNNRVVPKTEWPKFALEDGMRITIIRAVCGG